MPRDRAVSRAPQRGGRHPARHPGVVDQPRPAVHAGRPREARRLRHRLLVSRAGRDAGVRLHQEPDPAPDPGPARRQAGPRTLARVGALETVPRIFGHYVPAPLLALATTEAFVVFGSVFVGLALPLVGIPEIRPAWGDAFAPAAILAVLFLTMADIAGLYDIRQQYGRREMVLRLGIAFTLAYLGIAMLGYFVAALFLSRKAFVLSFVAALVATILARLAHDRLTAHRRTR